MCVHYRHIEMGRDFGTHIEITSGLQDDDQVVTNPGERLSDGIKVRILNAPTSPARNSWHCGFRVAVGPKSTGLRKMTKFNDDEFETK